MRPTILLLPLILCSAVPLAAAETVAVPAFQSVQLRGGGDVVVRPGPVQRVTIVSGSSQFTRVYLAQHGQLRIDACNRSCPRHYELKVEIQSPDVPDVAIQGGGSITAAHGFAPQAQLSAAVDGGGLINARALRATNVTAAVNGGGRILTSPARTLTAAINRGGEVRYTGNPETTVAIHGGGAVQRD